MPSQMAVMTLPIPLCEEMLTGATLGGSRADIHSFSDFKMPEERILYNKNSKVYAGDMGGMGVERGEALTVQT